jgi:hypothetical protein
MTVWAASTTGPGVANLVARILKTTAGRWTPKDCSWELAGVHSELNLVLSFECASQGIYVFPERNPLASFFQSVAVPLSLFLILVRSQSKRSIPRVEIA